LVGQATMRHILQRQVRSSVPPAASMNGHNGWMSEQGSQLGGTTQPGFPFFLGAYSGHEHFESDGLLKRAGQGMEDGASRPLADLINDLVAIARGQARQALSRAQRHGSYWSVFQKTVQVFRQLEGTGISPGGFFFQAFEANRL